MLEVDQMMFNTFEPKKKNRYIFEVDGIPSYVIKATNRPTYESNVNELDHINVKRKIKGKSS
jgi:hypothetical protein